MTQRPMCCRLLWGLVLPACVERGEVLTPEATQTVEPEPSVAALDAASERPGTLDSGAGNDAAAPGNGDPMDAPSTGVSISLGDNHACAVLAERLYCWGANESGQLGTGDDVGRDEPLQVASSISWSAIQAGYGHSCGLDTAGAVSCWGNNEHGQLGQGDRQSRSIPVLVNLPLSVIQLAVGVAHSCAVLSDGRLYCWGDNLEGQLGQGDDFGDETDELSPVQVDGSWRGVAGGGGHSCAIGSEGSVWCWGRNTDNQCSGSGSMQIRAPLRVDSATNWVQTVAGQGHSCALKQQGSLWCWGANTASQTDEGYPLGTADVTRALMPRQVGEKSEWLSVATDTFHSCGLERGGALWCWGRNQEGQLGLGDDQSRPEPQRVAGDYVAVGVGRFFTCAVTRDEEVRCAGANNLGQLGVGDRERRDQLTQVLLP